MLSIGNKKYRNLQEQVGYNTQQIEKIFETLDGLNVQDNVVIVPDMSYILSEKELGIVNKEVAFIVYDNQLYIKKGQDASLAYFDVVFTISGSTTVISFNSKEIQVTLSNGALGIVVSSASTYNQTQIDSLLSAKASITYVDSQLASGLALKANLSGANFTGAITGPSIIENMSGYSFAIIGTPPNTDREFIYAGAVKNGNKLTLAVAMNLTNTTGTQDNGIPIGRFYIPSAVLDKIFPTQIGTYSFVALQKCHLYKNETATPLNITCYAEKRTEYLELSFRRLDNLIQNDKYFVRVEITFLLSDNLAQ